MFELMLCAKTKPGQNMMCLETEFASSNFRICMTCVLDIIYVILNGTHANKYNNLLYFITRMIRLRLLSSVYI